MYHRPRNTSCFDPQYFEDENEDEDECSQDDDTEQRDVIRNISNERKLNKNQP